MVPAHTNKPIVLARCVAGRRSAAAYRARFTFDCPSPSTSMPPRSSTNEPRTMAAAQIVAPNAANPNPDVKDSVRPNRLATQVKTIAPVAIPTVPNAEGRPLKLVEANSPPASEEIVTANR